MKVPLLSALLALSVIFNIFFIAGAMQPNRPEDPIASITRVANELSLDQQQADRLSELRASFREETALVREELHEVHDAIGAEMASESPDGTKLRTLMQREAALIGERRAAAQQHFGHFAELLTPEQRHHLGRRMHPEHGRRDHRADPPYVADRFDADGDGVLNESERAEARKSVEIRRNQQATWRAEMRQKFDENQDGRLDANEREAMRAWLLEQGITPPDDSRDEHRRRRGGGPPRGGPRGPGGPPSGNPPQGPPPNGA